MSRSSLRATTLGTTALFLIFGGLAVAAPIRGSLQPPPAVASQTPAPHSQLSKAPLPGASASRAPSGFAELVSPTSLGSFASIVRAGGADGGAAGGAARSPAPSTPPLLELANLKPGDAITITRPDHSTVTYRVTGSQPPVPSASPGQGPTLLTPQLITTPPLQLIGAGSPVGPLPPVTVIIPGLLRPSPSP